MTQNELNIVISAEISESVPGKGAFSAYNNIVLVRLKDFKEQVGWIVADFSMNKHFPVFVQDADINKGTE